MKVLIVHNRYQEAGGEEAVVTNEYALLKKHGWEPRVWCVSNDIVAGAWSKMTTAMRTSYSGPARKQAARIIAEFSPTVVHVHNFFPLLSPSIYDACREAGVAVVQTLHNYRTICPGAHLWRGGHSCEDCIGASSYRAVLHACYRNSRIGSLVVARMVESHRHRGTWSQKVDRFIALSAFAKGKFVAAGFPADRIEIKPNFAEDRPLLGSEVRIGALYVGRLSREKGTDTLLQAWAVIDVPLRVVGDGPMLDIVKHRASARLLALGRRSTRDVAAEMARAAFLILPSHVYENFPMVVAEAFCQRLPIIASRIGTLPEIVQEGATGLLFSPGEPDDLVAKVLWAHRNPEAMRIMGANARKVYLERYSPAANFRQLEKIYKAAIEQRRSAAPAKTVPADIPRY